MKDNLKYKIIKNVLNEQDFNNLHDLVVSDQFPWFMGNVISYKEKIHFAHFLFNDDYIKSPFFNIISPVLKKLKSVSNTLVLFDSNEKHTGSTCTDKEYRIIININYYE